MNVVTLIGRITKDLELKYTNSNKEYLKFTLAVSRDFKNQDNEYEADFIRCSTFGKTAKLLNQYCKKGSKIAVNGRIQTGSYDNERQEKVFTTEIMINKIEFLDTKQETKETPYNYQEKTNQFEEFGNNIDNFLE